MSAFDRAASMAKEVGMHVERVRRARTTSNRWDGETAFLVESDPGTALHELAHYQVAQPGRRNLREYGIPSLGFDESWYEEGLASMLGICWERHLGLDWEATFCEHNWYGTPQRPAGGSAHYLRHLRDLGLIVGLVPQLVLCDRYHYREKGLLRALSREI